MKVELTAEEKNLPYVKYFNQDMAPVPQEKLDIWKAEAAAPERARPIEDRNSFLNYDTSDRLENGFAVAANGTGFVANSTFMPGVTAEMMTWWFGWHSVGNDLRYKLWNPEDHYHARADQPDYVLDPSVPPSQKTWGMNHVIKEDIGFGPEDILLCFKRPSDLGYDEAKLGTKGCADMVCAVGKGDSPALMTHKWYEENGGLMFKSHFWMGYGLDESGALVKLLPEGVSIPEAGPRALFGHNIKEYTNLGSILPSLYAEEKDNW